MGLSATFLLFNSYCTHFNLQLQESLEKSQNRTKELEDGNVLIAAVKEMEEKVGVAEQCQHYY